MLHLTCRLIGVVWSVVGQSESGSFTALPDWWGRCIFLNLLWLMPIENRCVTLYIQAFWRGVACRLSV